MVALVVLKAGAARADLVDEATTACKAKSTVAQMDKFIGNNDMRSLHKLLDLKTKVGDCKPLKARIEVRVEKRDGDLACVKAKGDTRCFWVIETTLRITSEAREPVRQDYFACQSQLYLETGRKILAGDDPEAIKRFQIATNQSGQCLSLKKGEQVDVERRDDKVLCVRPPGEDQCYWTDNLVLPPAKVAQDASGASAKVITKASVHKTHRKRK